MKMPSLQRMFVVGLLIAVLAFLANLVVGVGAGLITYVLTMLLPALSPIGIVIGLVLGIMVLGYVAIWVVGRFKK